MLVDELKSKGLPKDFLDCMPSKCEVCGSPLEISETLTGLRCSNAKCKGKLVQRIKAICKSLGITDFGESTISKYIDTYGITNHLAIFSLKEGMSLGDGVSPKISTKVISQILEHKTFTLWEFIQVANLPYIQSSARKIFQGYSDIVSAYKDIEAGGIAFIQDKLGISSDIVSLQAVKLYNVLLEFKSDLIEGVGYVIITDTSELKELNVVCSDQVGGGFTKKSEFYGYCKKTFGNSININFLNSVTKGVDYLVWAGADGSPARYTTKVQKAEAYKGKGVDIDIVTASQFISMLKKVL